MKGFLVEFVVGLTVDAEDEDDAINRATAILGNSNIPSDYEEFSYVEELDDR